MMELLEGAIIARGGGGTNTPPLHKVTHYLPLALFQLPPIYKKSAPESPKVGVPPPCVVPVAVCEECG